MASKRDVIHLDRLSQMPLHVLPVNVTMPAGPVVAEEVERGMMPADQFPAYWEWMGRVDKLRDQLSDC